MKYGKALRRIIENYNYEFIDYNYLKKNILSNNFLDLLINHIKIFNNNYIQYYNKIQDNQIYNSEDIQDNKLYEYILINYLSINKILKKCKKKNITNYNQFTNSYISIHNYLKDFEFYKHILDIPDSLLFETKDLCSICLDKCKFPVTTNCNHTYCWSCLVKTNNNFDFCPYCKSSTTIDPTLIILNNIIKCDKKYSPFNNNVLENIIENKISYKNTIRELCKFDIVSDLHIDHWSKNYKSPYVHGHIVDKPYELSYTKSDYLIVAGDVADDLDSTLDYLNKASIYYKKILFVDGNHEHVNKYPELYSTKYINSLVNNDKLIYLSNSPYIINNTAFIGCCGWWNYDNNNNESIIANYDYFNNWINHFKIKENKDFINNVIIQAKNEYNYLNDLLKKYTDDENIKNVVIVTHTLPISKYCDTPLDSFNTSSSSTEYNTDFSKLLQYKKISHWIFGHTHKQYEETINNIKFICNPRGRPNDFNRLTYNLKTLVI